MKYFFFLITLPLFFANCTKTTDKSDVIETVIIGGGLMGSSTAWHLSNQGNSVLLLEKQDSVYSQGSSLGEARIARSNNRGDDIWSYLHNKSVTETLELISFLQSTGIFRQYKMEDIYTTSPVTYVGRTRIHERLLASLIRQEIDYEIAINPEEGKSKFDVILPDSVLIQREYNKHSGTLNPSKLITYLHEAVRKKGNKIKFNTQVTSIKFNERSDLFEIMIKSKKSEEAKLLLAQKVVCAAGPYNGQLLQEIAPYFSSLINPQRVFLAFLKIKRDKYEQLTITEKAKIESYYPVINSSEGTRKGSFFSMIENFDKYNLPVIKIGGHFQRSDIKILEDIWTKALSEFEVTWSIDHTADYFKLLNLPIEKSDIEYNGGYSCVYSLTESEVPYVTQIIAHDDSPNDRFIVLGGMSGVGAKGAMTYGLIAANILNQKSLSDPLYNLVKEELGFDRLVNDLK